MADNNKGSIGFLFDLDGVIIDSETEYTKIWAKINQEFPTGKDHLEDIIKGCTLPKILSEHFEESVRQAVSDRLHQLENQMHYEYLPFAREFLEELKERDLPRALVTSSDNQKMCHLWEELPEIRDLFDFIVTGDLVKTSKPSPEGYLLGASMLHRNPVKCAVFEDSLQGVKAGKNSGSFVVGMCGTLPSESLAPFSHIVINDFSEINLEDLILILSER